MGVETRKCYNCRSGIKGKKLLCPKCKDIKVKNTQGTYIIYNKI